MERQKKPNRPIANRNRAVAYSHSFAAGSSSTFDYYFRPISNLAFEYLVYLNECGCVYAGVFSIPEAPILQSPSLKYRSGLRHQSYQRNARIAVADRMRGYLRYAS